MEEVFSLQPKEWESDFFSFPIGSLRFDFPFDASEYFQRYPELQSRLIELLRISDGQYELLEADVDAKLLFAIPLLEEQGFRMVDSRCSFLTPLEKKDLTGQQFESSNPQIQIRDKTEDDFDSIAAMTVDFLVNDPAFLSRYKNVAYFTEGAAERYFLEWIRNAFHSTDALIAVAVQRSGEVIGFYIYEKKGVKNQLPIYKGILSVVRPEFRGADIHLALQSFIFGRLEEPRFYVDNTTQLANTGVIRNHIKSHRRLELISLVFFRKRPRL
jgi:hypothetical protein